MNRQGFWSDTLVALRPQFWRTLGLSMGINTLMILPSLYMLQVYDRVMISHNGLTLIMLTLVLTAGLVMVAWLEQCRTRVLVDMGQRLDDNLSRRIHQATLQRELRSPSAHPVQPLQDLNQIRQFVTGQGLFVLFDLPWFPIYLVIMFLLHPTLGWLGLGFSLVLVAIAGASHRGSRAVVEEGAELARAAQQEHVGKLRNAQVIHTLGMLPRLRERWRAHHVRYSAAQARAEAVTSRYNAISKLARHVQQSLALGAGAWLVIEGQITAGAMIAANILMTKALYPLDLLVSSWSSMLTARLSAARLSDLMHTPERAPAACDSLSAARVEWRQVSVRSAEHQIILHDLSLRIEPGRCIALTGPSGSGKTTLAKVLLGLWPAEHCSGQIWLDGVSVFDWPRETLGPMLGYLPQEPVLMEGSLAQNIARFGPPDPAQVVRAAQTVGIHELILSMPQGYDTQAGEAGQLLSGGQRQLVALAQALYGSPQLLVLDEPNSNLDESGERALVQALGALRERGCSVLLITHRSEILQAMDEVWHLHDGKWLQSAPVLLSDDAKTRSDHESA